MLATHREPEARKRQRPLYLEDGDVVGVDMPRKNRRKKAQQPLCLEDGDDDVVGIDMLCDGEDQEEHVPVLCDGEDEDELCDSPPPPTPPPSPPPPTPPPSPPPPPPHREKRDASREGEWFDWWGHRFTKTKKKKVWTGWQMVCLKHTDPEQGQSFKCNRSRGFRNLRALEPEEFDAENLLTLRILKEWAVANPTELGYADDREGHMAMPTDWRTHDLQPLDDLEDAGDQMWGAHTVSQAAGRTHDLPPLDDLEHAAPALPGSSRSITGFASVSRRISKKTPAGQPAAEPQRSSSSDSDSSSSRSSSSSSSS